MTKKQPDWRFEDETERLQTLSNMETFGGSFTVALSRLFFKADLNNKVKIMDTWAELFNKYRPKNWDKKE